MLKDYPVIKLSILFCIGITVQKFVSFPFNSILLLLSFSLLLLIISFFLRKHKRSFRSLSISLAVIISGIAALYIAVSSIKKYPFSMSKFKNAEMYGSVSNIELNYDEQLSMLIAVDSIRINNKCVKMNHNVLTRIRDNHGKLEKTLNAIRIGNYIHARGTIAKAREDRNPGEFNYHQYLELRNISAVFTSYSTDDFKILKKEKSFWGNFILSIKKLIYERIALLFDKNTGALMKGLLIGDKSELDDEVKTDFLNTGIVHILAVSGMHVVYILLIIAVISGRFNLYIQSLLVCIILLIFVFITGMQPSVIRATVMAFVLIAAFLTNRSTNIYNSLAISAMFILVLNPMDLFNPGFQLSYAAVLSIAVFYKYFEVQIKKLNIRSKIIKGTLLLFAVSLAAQIGTLPFIVFYFHKLSIISLVANLIAVPLTGVMVGVGVFTLFLSSFWMWAAKIYADILILSSKFLFWIIHILSTRTFSFIQINQFSVYDSIVFYAALIIVSLIIYKSTNLKFKLITTSLVILTAHNLFNLDDTKLLPEGKLSIMAIDIGQGDAFLIKFPDNTTALIDAGEANQYFDNGEKIIIPLLDRMDINQIDYGFISHVDSDHYSGFFSLIKEGRIKHIFKPALDSTYQKDIKLEIYLSKMKIPVHHYKKEIIKIGKARIYILNNWEKKDQKLKMNDKSGIMKLVYGKTSFLFTGDAEAKAEKFLCNNYGSFIKSNMLKLEHHGSGNSTTEDLLNVVQPQYALISAGVMNKFKHPAPETLQKLKQHKIKPLRTDQEGAILLVSDGEKINQMSWRHND